MWLIVTIIICKDFYLRGKEERELKTYKSYPSDHKAESWTEIKSCDFFFLSVPYYLVLYSVFALERFVFQVLVCTWSHHQQRTIFLISWPIHLEMRKGTILNMVLYLAEFPCWSRRRDEVLQYRKQGSNTHFLCSGLTMLPPSSGRGKAKQHHQNSAIWSHPCQSWDWEILKCFLKYVGVSQPWTSTREAARGTLVCRTYIHEPLLGRRGERERERTMCQQQGLHLL